MNKDDYRFPTKEEQESLAKELENFFSSIEPAPDQVVMKARDLAELLFTINPDVFGGRLENAEKWLQERLEETSQETGKEQENEMRRFLAGFPTTTAH